MTIYKCHFMLDGTECTVYSDDGVLSFSHGFWINFKLKYTKKDDAVYWIPPSCILYIEKIDAVCGNVHTE